MATVPNNLKVTTSSARVLRACCCSVMLWTVESVVFQGWKYSWGAQLPFVLSATLLILDAILSVPALYSLQHPTSGLLPYSWLFLRFYWHSVWGEHQQLWPWSLPPRGVPGWHRFIHVHLQPWLHGWHLQWADWWVPQQSLPQPRALHRPGQWLPVQLPAGHLRYGKHHCKAGIQAEFKHVIIPYLCSGVCWVESIILTLLCHAELWCVCADCLTLTGAATDLGRICLLFTPKKIRPAEKLGIVFKVFIPLFKFLVQVQGHIQSAPSGSGGIPWCCSASASSPV